MKDDDRKEFRIKMGKAWKALVEDDDLKAYRQLKGEAYNALPETMPADERMRRLTSTIRGKQILKTPEGSEIEGAELDDLINRIGETAYQRLKAYDAMVEQAAQDLLPP